MKRFLLTLIVAAFAVTAVNAQANVPQEQVKKECCKDHKDGKKCDKPADQQCPDCKEKAAAAPKHECKKGEGHECKEGMKHECKKGEGQECKEGMKHECKKGEGHECKEGMKPECKKGEGHECKEGMKKCDKAEGPKHECKEGAPKQCDKGAIKKMHEECKDHKDGQPCTKPADQQCPDCKEKAKKN